MAPGAPIDAPDLAIASFVMPSRPPESGPRSPRLARLPDRASRRVFCLVKTMFGKDQITAMADFIQGSLMLRFNKRRVG